MRFGVLSSAVLFSLLKIIFFFFWGGEGGNLSGIPSVSNDLDKYACPGTALLDQLTASGMHLKVL